MKKLKLFFACLLMAVLSIGQVWGAVTGSIASSIAAGDQVILVNTAENAELTGVNSSNVGTQSSYSGTPAGTCILTVEAGKYGTGNFSFKLSDGSYLAYTTTATSKNNNLWKSTLPASPSEDQNKQVSWSISFNASNEVTINSVYNTGRNLRYNSQSGQERFCCYTSAQTAVKFFKLSASSTPTVAADPEEVEVDAEAHASQSLALTYENWGTVTVDEVEATLWNNAACTETFDGGWISNVAVAAGNASVSFDIAANAGAARAAYLKIYALGDDASTEAETVVSISQTKYSAPTGTFELFSGDLAEGDYVITHASANAIKAEINSDRFAAIEVSPSANIITNPDESIVWHIAQSGEYWTIYNVAADKYAASTGAKNKGALLDNGTDDKALWSLSGTYDFINKQNTASSVNATLRYNNQNALNTSWACYASGTGSALVLYKKQVAGQPETPTFSVAGGNYEEAQSVEISCETDGAKIYYTLDGSKPSSTSTEYSTAIPVSTTTTIKAVAIKDDIESTVASATYTIVVWQTVDEIWSSITTEGPTNANVWGYVSQANVGGYNNNYYISVDGSLTANQLEIYKGDNAGNTVAVGDKVHVNGDLTIFNEIKEFKQNTGVIVHYAAKGALQSVAVDGTPTKTEYAANETFDPAGLKVYGTYANGFVGEITEGITWGNDLTDGKVTESTTVHVTATVSEIASPAYDVAVTVAAKTLVSIAVGTASYTIYTGEALPEPTVTATFSEGEPENVSAFAVYDSESVFDTEVIDNPDPQTITVSYTFGGATQTATYTVSVKDYANADDAPYTVTEALHIITAAIGNTESAREIVVAGTVSADKVSNYKNRYKISDGANELLVYNGKGFNDEAFTDANYPKVGDVMIVKGNVIYFNNNTPEFASGKSYPLSQIRPATIAIEDVASFEVGATDLTENDLDITTPSDGDITFVSGDDAVATIEANAIHAVAPGTVTITANLAATENVDALNYAATSTTFSVTVVAPATKYAITFDGNGADGGIAPTAIPNKAAGAEVTLPANTYTYTGHSFTGWKVYDENEDEVTVTAGAFTMPASPVTIKAQWAEISVWATTYTSNVTSLSYTGTGEANSQVKINDEDYAAQKVGSSGNDGSVVVTVPYGTHTLHFHAVAWNGKSVTIAASGVENMSESSFTLAADPGFKSSGTYTLENDPVGQYFVMTFTAVTEETQITFSKTAGDDKRFMLYGVNQEGGVLPELQSIAISGDLDNKSYKAGQALDMTGLTVTATYTLGGTPQTPVDVTNDPGLTWTYDPLAKGDTQKEVTANFGGKTASKTIEGLTVASADPKIYVSTLNVNFASVEVGDAVPAAQTITVNLTNIASVTATLGGTNPEAFSISKTEGVVDGDEITISLLANTDAAASYAATLTISDGEGGADDKTVNLSFAVTEPVVEDDVTGTWTLVTNATTLAAGKKVIIAQYVEADGAINTMAGQATNNRSVIASTVAGATLTPTVGTKVMTLADAGEGHFYLKTSDGEYLYNASGTKSYLKTKATSDDASWTIAVTAEGVATITAVENTTRPIMRYNPNTSGSPLFNCYASGQEDIALYMLEEDTPEPTYTEVRNGLNGGEYYTMCLEKAVTAVKAGSIWRVLSKAANGTDVILEEVIGTLEAGRPYIFRAAANTLEVAYTGDAVLAPVTEGNNGLVGSFTEELLDQNSNHYIIYNNALYYVNSANVYVGEHRAYLDMTGVPAYVEPQQGNNARRRVTMAVYGKDEAQGFDNLESGDAPKKVMIDGTLYIFRGEKQYDATGRLVK